MALQKPAPVRLTTNELRTRLAAFAHKWKGASSEDADEKLFTADFLACFDIAPHQYKREYAVPKQDGSTGYMDGFIPGKLIIEGKSLGKDLKKARAQAEAYRWGCPPHEQPRYVLLHDFERFVLFDLSQDTKHPTTLSKLPAHADWFRFLVDVERPVIVEETEADRKAAHSMAQLHEALLRSHFTGRDLEIFLTRLLFCFFADDTAIFGNNRQFSQLVQGTRQDGSDLGTRLSKLFEVLNQDPEKKQRSPLLDEELAAFAYINGQLFADRTAIPDFDSRLRQLVLDCSQLDWSRISPAIFGAMFQGVLEVHEPDLSRQASRRELGAHYTSERNILRAINPLFMDGLRAELQAAGNNQAKLKALYDKLPTLKVLDPACGCGNFLVIAYRELRLLENDLIDKLFSKGGQSKGLLDIGTLSRITVDQFYGLEIDASAAHIAQVAMWITDHQLNLITAERFGSTRPSIPLVKSAHIRQCNALPTDWASVLPPEQCSFVVGNPPFVGHQWRNADQMHDMDLVWGTDGRFGRLDYVSCWHRKAVEYMRANPGVATALVSTNSICQGEQVGTLWSWLFAQGIEISFAHRTFKWSNEGRGVAAVHCIILGLGFPSDRPKRIFDYGDEIAGEGIEIAAVQINSYLVDAPNVLLPSRVETPTGLPRLIKGSQPTDGGHLILSDDDAKALRAVEPASRKYLMRYVGGDELLNGGVRWCLWLKGVNPADLRAMPEVMRRVQAVAKFRLSSPTASVREFASRPALFTQDRQPVRPFLAQPEVSSERRRFIPIAFLKPDVVVSNQVQLMEGATLWHFGVLSSTMHNSWMRTVAGRLKSDYRYSPAVYNNYPWPQAPTDKQRQAIETAAQAVLDARALFPDATLADLYDPLSMPAELVKAHAGLDKAVDAAYGYKGGKDDASRVAYLFGLYQQLSAPLDVAGTAKTKKPRARTATI